VRALGLLGAALAASLAVAAPAGAQGTPSQRLVREGDHLYGEYCLSCHGPNGGGSGTGVIGAGPLRAQTLQRAKAPSLRGVGALAADFYLRTGYMPLARIGVQPRRGRVLLGETQIRALVAYVASLGPGPAIPSPHPERGSLSEGLQAFTQNCAGCHQVVAEGGYVTGALPPPLRNATPVQVAEAVRIGPYVMPRFSKRQLSDRQLNSLIDYVEYATRPKHPGGWGLGYIGPVPEGLVTWFVAMPLLIVLCLFIGRKLAR
jgi:ubiquinol-cytochrome c reductase cytochrome c subunit